MRIVTWNVNGIRNPFSYSPWSTSRSYKTIFETLRADIIVLQELKMQRKDLTSQIAHVPGYESFFTFPKAKKGYSGVAVYVNTEKCMPIKAEEGITGCLENDKRIPWRELNGGIGGYSGIDLLEGQFLDSEGRALILDFGMFVLIGIYCPNNSGPEREDYRLQYLDSLSRRVGNLIAAGRQVIVAGDVNVCCSLLDTADPKEALRVSENGDFMSNPGRQWLGAFLKSCVKDVVREFWPEREGMFTCWNTKINARPGNYGMCTCGFCD
ncbi:DNA-(apurinic or apyrimidinic site) lyase 2 [Neolecta irregularis DAH-3]|uniref:DNA-(Apurinic or apyrimidinic site) lyase 2 n=1 Tax=Neolecta irregularis (strain DAH-3) TaxID=1198029 RepID=A0A1U7LMH3_NEOID|nr:DNA-(apurinic or apyrimidinic site) lyase 2 [Neolecta irregularis DAH-3]|eukprot:OLL23866.1 DNA-(apurinic or apyrimidinic site) lyase 2 [Neolecta irregularis DAH-3]